MHRVMVFDTSVLCVWLKVPGKETCGPADDRWDAVRIQSLIEEEERKNSTFVLPLAAIIETGNHISQAPVHRYDAAIRLAEIILKAADAASPWAAFTEQANLWKPESLKTLAAAWPTLAAEGLSIGDATIKDVADYYSKIGVRVVILTGDKGLKSLEPAKPAFEPRRRR